MAMEFDLIPQGTLLQENGHGETVDIRASATRTFFCTMLIRDQIEQESVDVSIWGSADGENWGTQPAPEIAAAVLSGRDAGCPGVDAGSGSQFYPRGMGSEPVGARCAFAHVRSWIAPCGNSRDAAARATEPGQRSEVRIFSLASSKAGVSIKRGRKLTVGCFLVVASYPPEWSCLN